MSDHDVRWLWERWIDLWNGDLEVAESIIHSNFDVHRFPPPRITPQLVGREGLLALRLPDGTPAFVRQPGECDATAKP